MQELGDVDQMNVADGLSGKVGTGAVANPAQAQAQAQPKNEVDEMQARLNAL